MNTSPNFSNIPAELADSPRFVLWRKEPRFEGEEATKMPYNPRRHIRAKSNDPSTWASLPVTRTAFDRGNGRYAGIGFVLGDDAPYVGTDLDDCIDLATGEIAPRALRIIAALNTYSEISPSGGGIKLFGCGKMPTPDGIGKNYRKDPWGTGTGGIEMYRRGRFFTLTGNHLEGTPRTIGDCTQALARLYRELYPPQPERPRIRLDYSNVSNPDRVRRCAAYLDRVPESKSGNFGHGKLFHAACLTLRFGLADSDALALLHDYNRRADPPWDDREIERKLSEAHKKVNGDFGSMLATREQHHEPRRTRRIVLVGGAA